MTESTIGMRGFVWNTIDGGFCAAEVSLPPNGVPCIVLTDKQIDVILEAINDLEASVRQRYVLSGEIHPSQVRRFERDMEPVYNARRLLGYPEKEDPHGGRE